VFAFERLFSTTILHSSFTKITRWYRYIITSKNNEMTCPLD
jgi:hypothetical protein